MILVIGATGFLGSSLCQRLAHKGYSLRALARPTSDTLFLQALGVQVAAGDVRDLASVRAAMADCDTVIHAAARFLLWGPPELFEEINLWGTRNVLATAYALDVKRFIHMSTIIVVGPQPPGTIITEDTPCGPYHGDNYARTKMGGERLALSYAEVGLPAVMINFARLLEFVALFTGHEPFYPLNLAPYVFEDWVVNSHKARCELGFEPISFEEGARRTLDWYRSTGYG